MNVNVLGVKIDDLSVPEIIKIVEGWLEKGGKYYITTPNPEIVMMAQKDLELKKIINQSDLSIPDGVGLKLFSDIENNSPGVDVLEALVKLAEEKGFTTAFLGGQNKVAKQTAERLQKKYQNLKVVFAEDGGEVDEDGNSIAYSVESRVGKKQDKANSHNTPYSIQDTDILFVAFGPPKQEKWIARNLERLDVKVVMGVGGAFDYLSGKVPRAPKFIRSLGLEWLFRLIIQPWRIKRQFALFKYLWLVIH